jgi:anti-anti-sigma factor
VNGDKRATSVSLQIEDTRNQVAPKTGCRIGGRPVDRDAPWPQRHQQREDGHPSAGTRKRTTRLSEVLTVLVRPSSASAHVIELRANDHGHLDDLRARELERRLLELVGPGKRGNVIIDLSRVRSLTSRFLSVVESAARQVRSQKRRIVLCGLQPHCDDVLRANRPNTTFEYSATEEQAFRILAGAVPKS